MPKLSPKEAPRPKKSPQPIDPVRLGVGLRLKAAREGKGLTQTQVAERLSVRGGKGTVSAWETGRGAPDAFTLRDLAKLYDVSADAILWEDSLTPAAMKIAAEYDALNEAQKRNWEFVWLGFVAGASSAGDNLPMAPASAEPSTRKKETS